MPILTQDPPRTQQLQSLLSESFTECPPTTNTSRLAAVGDRQSWRGRKRSRSPSTSPVASVERMWRPWSGVAMARDGEGFGNGRGSAMNCAMEEERQRAFGGFGGSQIASSFASGVGLVVPLDQAREGNFSESGISVGELRNDVSLSAATTSETGISINEFNGPSAISRLHRSKVSSTRTPGSSPLDLRDVTHPQPQPSDDPRETNDPWGTHDVVPVWDVNASIDNKRIGSSGSPMPRAIETAPAEPTRRDVDRCESKDTGNLADTGNSHYVSTNAVLRDLHAQRRTRRPFATLDDASRNELRHKGHGKTSRSPSPRSMAVALPVSPSASITSASTSRSEDRDAERALLVAGHEGIGMRYDVHADPKGKTGRGNASPVRRGRVLSYDSDESDGGREVGTEDAGIDAGKGTTRQMSGPLASGYEDMNRLLGRLAIQRRGCRRA